jgi:hypothetical protein
MSSLIGNNVPTSLEAEYKRLQREAANDPPEQGRSGISQGNQEDVVTLSSRAMDTSSNPVKLKPSQPVTPSEMQALRFSFSVYG